MSSKFGFSSRYENLAKELIRHILGLTDEDDENFTASMDFVMSNLLYHHYLDVNSHTVQRSLEGVSFKMTVHGHQKKAEQLQTLIKKFLSLPVIEEK
ncbi:Gamma-tubulin complex component 5, partial [Armadillidium nasatum]